MPSHRADTPTAVRRRPADSATAPDGTGRTRGGAHARPTTRHTTRRSRRASVPALVGATALTLATVTAVTLGGSQADSSPIAGPLVRQTALPSAVDGASSLSARQALTGRVRAVSRDSQRTARRDAADQDLQAVVERQARLHDAALARLAAGAKRQSARVARRAAERAAERAARAWHLPVTSGAYHLTSRFGQCSSLWARCHTGLDFAAPTGTPIHAVASGTITEMGYAGSYGNRTIETLEDGTVLWYAHQSSFVVRTGQKVVAGQVIGAVGATGNTTGPHVHLEVRPGGKEPVDPFAALVAHGLKP